MGKDAKRPCPRGSSTRLRSFPGHGMRGASLAMVLLARGPSASENIARKENRMRVCTLFPAATEIVFALGLGDSLVGVSHECNYPAAASKLPSITRSKVPAGLTSAEIDRVVTATLQAGEALYGLDAALLERLSPDLIITQALCEVCALSSDEVRQCLSALTCRPRLLSLEANSLAGILDDISTVAVALGGPDRGERLVGSLQARIEAIARRTADVAHRPRVFCMEWVDPPYCGGHWMKELVESAGGEPPAFLSRRLAGRARFRAGNHRAHLLRVRPRALLAREPDPGRLPGSARAAGDPQRPGLCRRQRRLLRPAGAADHRQPGNSRA